jgi:predicted Zn-dependent peptidase
MVRLIKTLAARWIPAITTIFILFNALVLGTPIPALAQTPSVKIPSVSPKTSVQPYLDRVIKNISEFQLANGMKFIVLERHNAPVISFRTYVDVGGADEDPGKTGISHFLEHLAFKGTTRIGTQDYAKEKVLLDRQDQLWETLKAAKKSGNPTEVEKLQAEFKALDAELLNLSKQNEFGQIIERSGGVGLNATTAADATNYFFSFPSNKLELWMSLESDRFLDPVFREFFKEQAVIQEERRMRIDNSPIGKLIEEYLPTAFKVHPYRQPVAGYAKDIDSMDRSDIQAFFNKYYTPDNLTVSIVGDVNAAEVKTLANTYFGRLKPAAQKIAQKIDRKLPVEPAQTETRTVKLKLPSEPIYLEGYHRPALNHPDNATYEAIASLLSDGRTSRLYKSLVESKKIALSAEGFNGFPGDKFPNLIMFYALSAPGHTVEEIQTAIDREIQRLKTEPVTQVELDRIKTNARASLLRSLSSNSGMASALVEYQVKTGNWRNLFNQLEAISAITPADIQRVSKATFRPENKTIGEIVSDRA